jgi:dTDP-4-dehydrorhamnose reductase
VKLLVVGRDGQLARSVRETAAARGVEVIALGRPQLDILDKRSVAVAVARERPAVVLNAAAYTAVDRAESQPEAAHAVNALGPEHVASACAEQSIPIIHISTDYVFDGAKQRPYVEDDPTGPINVYGRTKLEGEQRVAAACARHLILRTAWVHSPWGANFVKTMLRLAATRPGIGVVADQTGSPTYAPDLAAVILTIVQRIATGPKAMGWGTYHAVGAGETSWFGFAEEVFRRAAERGLPAAEPKPITTAAYPTPARRPANSRLNCDKLRLAFGLELPGWRSGVDRCVNRLAAGGEPS